VSRYAVILFKSSHDAIRADKLLRDILPVTLMPTPRRFSASCGIALRFDESQIAETEELIRQHKLRGTIKLMED